MELRKLIIKEKEGEILEVPEERLCNVKVSVSNPEINGGAVYIATRGEAEFEGKAIFLPQEFDWILGRDSVGSICLVPLRKV